MGVDVILEDPRWADAGLAVLADRAVAATLAHLGLAADAWEVTVLGCDDARMATLNATFRGKARATNVLSWPSVERAADHPGQVPRLPSGDPELGDIALGFETCQREAAEQGKPSDKHNLHLIVHGVLHLLGYDHEDQMDGDLMESREIAILADLGVPNPYK
ncbi:MAG: rRNA maturation RNase YbeY [Pseudomonadota bacterium]